MCATPLSAPRAAAGTASTSGAEPLGSAASLPHIGMVAARALNRAYAWPSPFALALETGNYQLRWQADAPINSPVRVYAFRFGPADGRVVFDEIGERELIGDAASHSVPVEIRCALLADALAPVFDTLEQTTRQRVEVSLPERGEFKDDVSRARDALRFCVTKTGDTWRCYGALRFTDERYLGLVCPHDPPLASLASGDFDDLPVTFAFSLGSTSLSIADLRSIACGDIIGIERWSSAGTAMNCAGTTRDGLVRLVGKIIGARIVVEHIEEKLVAQTPPPDSRPARAPAATHAGGFGGTAPSAGKPADAGTPPAAGTLTQIDALEVLVTFELDERSMPLRDLKALQSGYVLELDQPLNQCTVHIRANGALVGQGHLIAVGNRLGVRVSRFQENPDG